jgi:hypothetical protein
LLTLTANMIPTPTSAASKYRRSDVKVTLLVPLPFSVWAIVTRSGFSG